MWVAERSSERGSDAGTKEENGSTSAIVGDVAPWLFYTCLAFNSLSVRDMGVSIPVSSQASRICCATIAVQAGMMRLFASAAEIP